MPIKISQNVAWTVHKGSYLIHLLITFLLLIIFLSFLPQKESIYLTIITYNIITFIFFHWILGDPFAEIYSNLTFWEQMNEQLVYDQTILFMGLYPILQFVVGTRIAFHYCYDDEFKLYFLCILTTCFVLVPKLGFMHKRRILGLRDIN